MAIRTVLVDVFPLAACVAATLLGPVAPWRQRGRRSRSASPAASPYPGVDPVRAAALQRLAGLCAAPRHAGVGRLVHRLAMLAGEGAASAERLQAVVPLYDIGIAAIPDRLLRSQAPLDAAELAVVQRHAAIGARLLDGDDTPLLTLAAEVALCHHERWDGGGYPRGLDGARIPLGARILAIVELFDAMLSGGEGRAPCPLEAAIEALRTGAGALFDPALTGLFLDDLPTMLALRDRPLDRPSPPVGEAGPGNKEKHRRIT